MRLRDAVVTGLTGLVLSAGADAFAQSAYRYRDREIREYRGDDRGGREWQARQIVRQAYRDILQREPDRHGLREYTDAMVHRGWSESDVRRALRRSPEYAQRFGRSRWYRGYR